MRTKSVPCVRLPPMAVNCRRVMMLSSIVLTSACRWGTMASFAAAAAELFDELSAVVEGARRAYVEELVKAGKELPAAPPTDVITGTDEDADGDARVRHTVTRELSDGLVVSLDCGHCPAHDMPPDECTVTIGTRAILDECARTGAAGVESGSRDAPAEGDGSGRGGGSGARSALDGLPEGLLLRVDFPLYADGVLLGELVDGALRCAERERAGDPEWDASARRADSREARARSRSRDAAVLISELDDVGALATDTSRRITQLKVYRQRHPSNCGFHTMHNALCILRATRAGSTEAARRELARLADPVEFWATFTRLHRRLRRERRWSDKVYREGLMNDYFTDPLIARDNGVVASGGSDTMHALNTFYALGVGKVRHVHNLFASIAAADTTHAAFMLGSSKHWVAVVANKVNGVLELVFADSGNKPIVDALGKGVGVGEAALEAALTARAEERVEAGRTGVCDYYRRARSRARATDEEMRALFDVGSGPAWAPTWLWKYKPRAARIKMVRDEFEASARYLDVIHQCSSGDSTLSTMWLEKKAHAFLKSFQEVAVLDGELVVPRRRREPSGGGAGEADGSTEAAAAARDGSDLVGVEHWVSFTTRAASVRTGLVEPIRMLGAHHLTRETLHRLAAWVRDVPLAITHTLATEPASLARGSSTTSEGGTPNISKLHSVLAELEAEVAHFVEDDALVEAHALLTPAARTTMLDSIAESSAFVERHAAASRATTGPWACRACTYINAEAAECEMCGTTR